MKSPQKDRLRETQLAYVGKLMAGLSHDCKNHLAIIRELSGLIDDLLLLEEPGQSTNSDRYKKITAGIDERIAQAAEMCRFLTGFSHRMDEPLSSFSLTDVLQEEIYLLHRFARQQQVKLVSSFEEGLPAIFNNPSLLQFAIFCILWPALELLETDSRILIAVARQGAAAEIIVNLEGTMKKPEDDTPWQEVLPEVIQMLGAEISRKTNQEGNLAVAVTISSIGNPLYNDT